MRRGLRTLAIWVAFFATLLAGTAFISMGGAWTVVGVAALGALAALLGGLTLYAYLRNRKVPARPTQS